MKHTTFAMIAGIIFALMALVHLARIIEGWDLTIADMAIPLWVSWAGLVIGGILGLTGIQLGLRKPVFRA